MTESKRDYAAKSLKMHYEKRGKIAVVSTVPVRTREDLSLAYTPGVAQPCLEIQKDVEKSFDLTRRWNMCLVVTDGTAVLGLGDIGPEAGMPVMEGKCVLFKTFGDVDAFHSVLKVRMWMKSYIQLPFYPAALAASIWKISQHRAVLKSRRS